MQKEKFIVPGLARGVAIVDLVAQSKHPLFATDIAKTLELPKSSVHGLLQTLLKTGLLKKDEQQRYYLGTHIMQWSHAFIGQNKLISVFQSEVAKMPKLNGYTLTLTTLEDDEVVYLACKESNSPLGFSFKTGMRLPAVFTATGKMMLSSLNDEEIYARLKQNWPTPLTTNSVTNIKDFMLEVSQIRENGYSIDNGQIRHGMYCLGGMLFDRNTQNRAGIAVSLIKEEFSQEVQHLLIEQISRLTKNIETQLGSNLSTQPN